MVNYLSKKPLYWLIGSVNIAIIIAICAWRLNTIVFNPCPITITMDRTKALTTAKSLATLTAPDLTDSHTAIQFYTDTLAKSYIEHANESPNLDVCIKENIYHVYTWHVRLFNAEQEHELRYIFTPQGSLYGFIEIIAETAPGKALNAHEARIIAETTTAHDLHIAIANYTYLTTSSTKQKNGRIDHTFTYEKVKWGKEGSVRLSLTISGDRLTAVKHYVQVPESFLRAYAEKRAINDLLTFFGLLFMLLMMISSILLHHCTTPQTLSSLCDQYRIPMIIGATIGTSGFIANINNIPIVWMTYNTALSLPLTITLISAQFIGLAIITTITCTIAIALAQSLTLKAFPKRSAWFGITHDAHINLPTHISKIISTAYITAASWLLITLTFYTIVTRYAGWWAPQELSFDPNCLATYLPWVFPFAASAQAGILEESLFRAIPLSMGLIISNRYPQWRRCIIISTFIIQSIAFGIAHCSYPLEPWYGRIIELIAPSIVFGILYILFGLACPMLIHFLYDIFLFSGSLHGNPHTIISSIITIIIMVAPALITGYCIYSKNTTHNNHLTK